MNTAIMKASRLMTSQEHLVAARAVAQTINHVQPRNRATRVKTWAAHIKAMLATPAASMRGHRGLR